MKLTVHTDPGHGWLFISRLQLQTLGLTTASFTEYSYHDESGVYAEEDFDAGTVLRAHAAVLGEQPQFSFVDHKIDAPCRHLPRCTGKFEDIMPALA